MSEALVAYLAAHRRFETLDRERDALLEPIDSGEATALSPEQQALLRLLSSEQLAVYQLAQVAERNLSPQERAQLQAAGLTL